MSEGIRARPIFTDPPMMVLKLIRKFFDFSHQELDYNFPPLEYGLSDTLQETECGRPVIKVTQYPLGSVSDAHPWISHHDVRKPTPCGGAMGSYLVADPTADHTGWAL